jgi:endonuclease/exonuclease/phosphatase (EEP) superfamily protein YafD
MSSQAEPRRAIRLLILVAKGALAAVAAWFVTYLAIGDGVPKLGYLNAAGFHWGLAAFLSGLFLLGLKRWIWGGLGIAMGAAIMSIGIGTDIDSFARPEAQAGKRLRVVSASLRTLNPNMRAAASMLLRTNGEVLAVQEARDPQLLLAELERQSGRSWNAAANGATMVLSHFPMVVEERPHEMLKVRLRGTAWGSLSLWTLRAPKDYDQPYALRRYFNALADQIRDEKPDIVAGDFNSTPWNDGYRIVAAQLSDSFRKGGAGPGFTFPTRARRMGALFPLVRIDHIFADPDLQVLDSFVGDASSGADHFAVVSEFKSRIP